MNDQQTTLSEFVEWCRDERERAAASLPRFESGEIKIGRQVPGEPMIDESADHIAHLKRIIENMDRLIAAYERDHAQGT